MAFLHYPLHFATMPAPTYIQNTADFYYADPEQQTSRLVLGTAGLGGLWGPVDPDQSVATLLYALEQGIERIDTAASYGNAQRLIGRALEQWSGPKPFISTKIGRLEATDAHTTYTDYSSEGLRRTLEQNLDYLGLSKVDLLFLHEPHLVPLDEMDRILNVLQDFKAEGLTNQLGIGGNPTPEFMAFAQKENFDIVSGFLQLNAANVSGLETTIPTLQARGLQYYAASPLHFGLLGSRFKELTRQAPNDWMSAADQAAAKALQQLAQRLDMPLPSMAQRYLFSVEEADWVVVGASNPAQIKATLQDWKAGPLPKEIFDQINEVRTKVRS